VLGHAPPSPPAGLPSDQRHHLMGRPGRTGRT